MTNTSHTERTNQRNAVLAGFLGWTLDAFDFFVLTFIIEDVAKAFGKTRPDIALTITLALATRPIGAVIFGMMADRLGRRLPLMINVIFYAVISVLSGLAPNYQVFLLLRMLFGIGMGGEWGVGASLALESVSPKWRGLFSGLLQEGYAMGNLLAALAFRVAYVPLHAANPENAWRYMFFIGGLPALLSLFIRVEGQGIRGVARASDRLAHVSAIDPAALAAVSLHRPADGDDELHVARHAGHVSDVPAAPAPVLAEPDGQHHDDLRCLAPSLAVWRSAITRIGAGRRRAMITSALCALLMVPIWIAAPSTRLIILGAFLMQFFVQGAWGVIPAHINELSPGHLRGFFPGFAYQLGVLVASSITYVESLLGEHFTYAQSMGVLAATVMVGVAVVTFFGPENHRVTFRKLPGGTPELQDVRTAKLRDGGIAGVLEGL